MRGEAESKLIHSPTFFARAATAANTCPEPPNSRILINPLLDLPDVEIDEAHSEQVAGEKGELVFAVRVVPLEDCPRETRCIPFPLGDSNVRAAWLK